VGTLKTGQRAVAAFVNGIDLDVVPFALDAADMHGVENVVIAIRQRDVTESLRRMVSVALRSVELTFID
jgi:hypothetical protein